MRNVLLTSAIFLIVGCAPPVDHTPNRSATDPTATNDAVGYPPGPYGYKQDRIIENLQFTGKIPSMPGTDYSTLPMQKITLNDFRINPAVKLVFMVGSARWCVPCNEEQPKVRDLGAKYQSQGVQLFDVLVEGAMPGDGAIAGDIDKWSYKFSLNVPVGIDPDFSLSQYADVSAFPLGMMIRTSDMKIVWMCIGGQCDPESAILKNLQ
jgi:hypothetical protein